MFFSVFYAIPPSVTTWNLSRKGVIAKIAYLAEFWSYSREQPCRACSPHSNIL